MEKKSCILVRAWMFNNEKPFVDAVIVDSCLTLELIETIGNKINERVKGDGNRAFVRSTSIKGFHRIEIIPNLKQSMCGHGEMKILDYVPGNARPLWDLWNDSEKSRFSFPSIPAGNYEVTELTPVDGQRYGMIKGGDFNGEVVHLGSIPKQ